MVTEASANVFISYRHESDAHRARVRDLAERIERAGIAVVFDQFAQAREFNGGGPNDGWPRWCKRQASTAQRVLFVASAGWFHCYERKDVGGTGLGAAAEAAVLDQMLYNQAGVNRTLRLVAFDGLQLLDVPVDLQCYQS